MYAKLQTNDRLQAKLERTLDQRAALSITNLLFKMHTKQANHKT